MRDFRMHNITAHHIKSLSFATMERPSMPRRAQSLPNNLESVKSKGRPPLFWFRAGGPCKEMVSTKDANVKTKNESSRNHPKPPRQRQFYQRPCGLQRLRFLRNRRALQDLQMPILSVSAEAVNNKFFDDTVETGGTTESTDDLMDFYESDSSPFYMMDEEEDKSEKLHGLSFIDGCD